MGIIKKIYMEFIRELLIKSSKISMELFKVMIPMTVLTKVLEHFGAVEFLGRVLEPVMSLMGLKGELGLVWAASMITNIYGGLSVFAGVYPGLDLTRADITVLGLIILVAHSLPVELGIAKKAGVKVFPMLVLRVGAAVIMGLMVSFVFTKFNLLQGQGIPVWQPEKSVDPDIISWIYSQGTSLFYIFLIILTLVILMDILERLKIMDWLTKKISVFISPLGMTKNAGFLAVTGFTLGISYGGGLIISEAESGRLTEREVFFSLSLMGLSHGIIEDTLLMAAIGGSLWGLLFARILLSFIFIRIIVAGTSYLSDKNFSALFIEQKKRPQQNQL
ncbi:MAG: nucleoside recognition domain-containing protein [Thermodesulfobacteriota bacterium]